jgi:hypothetical protein
MNHSIELYNVTQNLDMTFPQNCTSCLDWNRPCMYHRLCEEADTYAVSRLLEEYHVEMWDPTHNAAKGGTNETAE